MTEYTRLRRSLAELLEQDGFLVFDDEDQVFDYFEDNVTDSESSRRGFIRETDEYGLLEALEGKFQIFDKHEEVIYLSSIKNVLNELYIQYTMQKPLDEHLLTKLFSETIQRDI